MSRSLLTLAFTPGQRQCARRVRAAPHRLTARLWPPNQPPACTAIRASLPSKPAVSGFGEALRPSSQCRGQFAATATAQFPAFVHRNGSAPSVNMAILDVRAALTHGGKTQFLQQPAHLGGLQDRQRAHTQATAMLCVPMNSASRCGSPSSSSMAMTSLRLSRSSSSDSACECAPGKPGT